jgi:hypothetical protein
MILILTRPGKGTGTYVFFPPTNVKIPLKILIGKT